MNESWMSMDTESGRVKVRVVITDSGLSWSRYKDHVLQTGHLASQQILISRATVGPDGGGTVIVHYIKVVEGKNDSVTLRTDSVTLVGSRSLCDDIASKIELLLRRREGSRPRRVLLFMNPASGWGNSVKQYQRHVAPVFQLCGVAVHDIVTEHADHARDVLASYDLSTIDAVVSMGGDGSVKQVVTGLLERQVKDAGVDMDNLDALIPKPRLPVGVIPCGSGMAISVATNCSRDLETSALNIVIGKTANADVILMRNRGKFIGYGNVLENVGLVSNTMARLEELRWMGTLRYTAFVCVPVMWSYFRKFNVEVEYKAVSENHRELNTTPSAHSGGRVSADLPSTTDGPLPGWKTYRGQGCNISVIPWNLMDFAKDLHLKENAYKKPTLSTGKALLTWEKGNGFLSVIKCMGDISNVGRRFISSDASEQIEVSECSIRTADGWSDEYDFMCHDGDVLPLPNGPDIHVKVCANSLDMICIDDIMITESRKFR